MTKELGLVHLIMDVPLYPSPYILACYIVFQCQTITRFSKATIGIIFFEKMCPHLHIWIIQVQNYHYLSMNGCR
jgi:hypothetical protein